MKSKPYTSIHGALLEFVGKDIVIGITINGSVTVYGTVQHVENGVCTLGKGQHTYVFETKEVKMVTLTA